jgi:hypothetical protein
MKLYGLWLDRIPGFVSVKPPPGFQWRKIGFNLKQFTKRLRMFKAQLICNFTLGYPWPDRGL